jgi:hypothetical protein
MDTSHLLSAIASNIASSSYSTGASSGSKESDLLGSQFGQG